MKTSLVYVLTCAADATYIEQALMAIWSARYWNPTARIVLLIDDITSSLLHAGDKRGEILKYIDEEVVSTFTGDKSMLYRSRWIKTKVRELVKGELLFVDSDTICCRSLADVDNFDCEIGAIPESMLPVAQFHPSLLQQAKERCQLYGLDITHEEFYWCSGVLYAKDTPCVHKLFDRWHQLWKDSFEQGNVFADQPPLARANADCGHIISRIPDSYNNITFTQNSYTDSAHILHFSSYRNTSFLFSKKVLNIVREQGISAPWLQYLILHSTSTYLPFDSTLLNVSCKDLCRMCNGMAIAEKLYAEHVDPTFSAFPIQSKLSSWVIFLYQHGYYRLASAFWLFIRTCHVYHKKSNVKQNVCSK